MTVPCLCVACIRRREAHRARRKRVAPRGPTYIRWTMTRRHYADWRDLARSMGLLREGLSVTT